MTNNQPSQIFVEVGGHELRIEDIVFIAQKKKSLRLSQDAAFKKKIKKGAEFLDRLLAEDGVIYGVTTGYGDNCDISIPADLVKALPRNLYTFHGVGTGSPFSPELSRAILAVRVISLSRGVSGVSFELLEQLEMLLHKDLPPVIPQEGSVGASGDLTPLSYVAAVVCGERQVYMNGEITQTNAAFKACGISALTLRPKEGLAIMNGTAVMTALACFAYSRAQYLTRLSARITAFALVATDGNPHHFDEILFKAKPHPGMQRVAAWLRSDLHGGQAPRNEKRLQDRYSLRCAPHVIGVLEDALPWLRQFIENELNSANDNPLVDSQNERVLHGGHFYGGHISFAMDSLKAAVASLADLMDRQLALLVDPRLNHGLPANLSGAPADQRAIHHGFKALGIAASAWAAEALKLTMPAASFSRSTESNNQDKVSMGTIAARDCLRVLELSEQVAVAALLGACQGLELRRRERPGAGGAELQETLDTVRKFSPFLSEDRALETDIKALIEQIRSQKLPVPSEF